MHVQDLLYNLSLVFLQSENCFSIISFWACLVYLLKVVFAIKTKRKSFETVDLFRIWNKLMRNCNLIEVTFHILRNWNWIVLWNSNRSFLCFQFWCFVSDGVFLLALEFFIRISSNHLLCRLSWIFVLKSKIIGLRSTYNSVGYFDPNLSRINVQSFFSFLKE